MASDKPPSNRNLTIDDLGIVLTELYPVRDKWYNIGLQLNVSVVELQRIESEYKNDHTTCLRQMLIKWLELGRANWRSLCEALQCPIVLGEDRSLATNLLQKYCETGDNNPKKRKASDSINPAPGTPMKVLISCCHKWGVLTMQS